MALEPLPDRPLVSVLVTNYNYGKYVGEAIESILAQTYPNFEIIICDDGSADNSCEVIERYCKKDQRVNLISQINGGQGAALNTAFGAAKGEVIVLLDGDDIALENRLELVVQAFHESPEAGMVTHALRICDAQGKLGGRDPEEPLDEGWLAPALLHGPEPVFPPTSGLALRRETAQRIFPLPWNRIPDMRMWDWPVREGAAFLAPIAALDETPGLYRLHGKNLLGHGHFTTLSEIERRYKELAGAMEIRRLYSRAFLGAEPDEMVCNTVVGTLVLSRAALTRERLLFSQIARYSRGKSRLAWTALFLLPSGLTKCFYLWARKSGVPMKGRWLKGHVHRFLKGLAGVFGIRWEPGRRVRQNRFPYSEMNG